jgi:hypothetical protein
MSMEDIEDKIWTSQISSTNWELRVELNGVSVVVAQEISYRRSGIPQRVAETGKRYSVFVRKPGATASYDRTSNIASDLTFLSAFIIAREWLIDHYRSKNR